MNNNVVFKNLIIITSICVFYCANCFGQTITYQTPQSFTKGKDITPLIPDIKGISTATYSIDPPLPADLQIDPNTGKISGKPANLSPEVGYIVTAKITKDISVKSAPIKITINQAVPNITYKSPDTYKVGLEITELGPTNSGGQATKYSIDPALPDGLALSPSTGVIIGTPTEASDATDYTITAVNDGGKASAKVIIAVKSANKSDSAIVYISLIGVFLISGGIIYFLVVLIFKSKKDANEALGLPSGSVRAIIAILLVVFFMLLAVIFYFDSDTSVHNTDLSKQLITILGTLVTAVSSFYFGSKAGEQAQSTLQNALQNQGAQGQQVKVTVSLDATVTGALADAAAAALNSTSVQMIQAATNMVFHGSHLPADPNGVFTFTGLPTGSYTISGSLPVNPALMQAPASPPSSPPAGTTLTGTMTNQQVPPGTPITLTIK